MCKLTNPNPCSNFGHIHAGIHAGIFNAIPRVNPEQIFGVLLEEKPVGVSKAGSERFSEETTRRIPGIMKDSL